MGKPTGFKEFARQAVPYRDPLERVQRLSRDLHRARRSAAAHAGRSLHGLRRAVLPERLRLPDRQPHSRVERPGLPGPLERRARSAPQDEQLPRVHRPHLPGAVRRRLRARHHRARRSRSRTSKTRSSTAALKKVGSRRSRRRSAPARRSRSSAAVPSGLAAAAQLNKVGHTSPSTSGPTASAAC